jgi:hypothetical protein
MPNYQNSKIYKICSYQTDEIYIGSTTQPLYKRFGDHKSRLNSFKKGKRYYTSSFEILKYDDCYIELIGKCPCNDKEELLKIEGQFIKDNECVNKRVAGRTSKEWREENKEIIFNKKKKYREENKEKIALRKKKYSEENKEKISERRKKYYEDNKETILKRQKEYNDKNKEKKAIQRRK